MRKYSFVIIGLLMWPLSIVAASIPAGNAIPWIKLGWKSDELPVVQLKANGIAVRAFFDTGAGPVSMNPAVAEKLGVQAKDAKGRYEGQFAGGKISKIVPATLSKLEIGSRRMDSIPALIIPGAEAHSWKDITIGVEFLQRQRILMDYRERKMVILDKPYLSTQNGAARIPFEFIPGSQMMIVRARVDGKERYLHFDTGGTFALDLRRKDAGVLGLKSRTTAAGGKGGAGQEVSQTEFDTAVKVCLAAICKEVAPISLNEPDTMWDPLSERLGKRISGVISHSFLSGLRVEFDIPNRIVWLQ